MRSKNNIRTCFSTDPQTCRQPHCIYMAPASTSSNQPSNQTAWTHGELRACPSHAFSSLLRHRGGRTDTAHHCRNLLYTKKHMACTLQSNGPENRPWGTQASQAVRLRLGEKTPAWPPARQRAGAAELLVPRSPLRDGTTRLARDPKPVADAPQVIKQVPAPATGSLQPALRPLANANDCQMQGRATGQATSAIANWRQRLMVPTMKQLTLVMATLCQMRWVPHAMELATLEIANGAQMLADALVGVA